MEAALYEVNDQIRTMVSVEGTGNALDMSTDRKMRGWLPVYRSDVKGCRSKERPRVRLLNRVDDILREWLHSAMRQ